VAAKLKRLKYLIFTLKESSDYIDSDLFGEAKVGSCLEILELCQQEEILDQFKEQKDQSGPRSS
jgi:hypothetical protein